jgi:hypothetical protein
VEYIQQCKIKFEPPKHKRDIAQCANYQRYGHAKNYCHLKPRCMKCTGDHLTNQSHRKERSSDVRCVLCGGNHPANYKGCTVYKENIPTSLFETVHSCTNQTNLTHSTRSNICANNQTKFICCHKYRARSTHKPTSSANQLYTRLKKYDESLFEQMGTMLNLLTTVLTKLK